MADLSTFLAENRKQPKAPVDLRGAIEKTNLKQENKGTLPYMKNAVNSVNRGLTQVVETPWNIINNAPKIFNLLPGEQGMKKNTEYAAEVGGPVGNFIAGIGEDPLIDMAAKHYPGMEGVGGIDEPNPNYPRTSQFGEDVGLGVGGMGLNALAAKFGTGIMAKFAQYLNAPVAAAPIKAGIGEVAAAGGAATGREIADRAELGPVGKFFAEFMGSMSPGALAYSGPAAIGKVFSREGGGEALEAMERVGVRPSIGITGNQNAATLENAAAIMPVLGGTAKKVQNQQLDQFGTALSTTATKLRPKGALPNTGETMIGEQVRDISEQGLQRMKAGFGGREDALMAAIGPQSPVDITNTRKAITDMIPKVDPTLQGALKKELELLDQMAAGGNTVPYEQLRSFRSNVGKRTDQPSLAGGQSKQIYKAITADTEAVANAAGQGDEFRTLMKEQATAHDDTLKMSDGGDIPAMEKIASGQSETGRNFFKQAIKNPDRAALLKRNATDEQWKQFTGDTAEYLGLAKDSAQGAVGDAFSPNTFLTNWNAMDPRTKLIMFDDGNGTLDTLNDLAIVAEGMKMRGNATNFSNTAGVGMSATALAGVGYPVMAGNLPGAAAGATMSYATIKALMSQTLAKWAAGRTPTAVGTMGARAPGAAAKAATDEDPGDHEYR